jgi:hypothetical protein
VGAKEEFDMKKLIILSCSILYATTVALCQGGPQTIMIVSRTVPPSTKGEAILFADAFQTQVVGLLQDEYPCAQIFTRDDVAAVLQLKREQVLLDTDTDTSLESLAGAVGAKYLISLTVIENGSGQVGLNATMMNGANSQPLAKSGTVTSGGEAALDAIAPLAKKFVDGLSSLKQFSKANCTPTNPWSGTISYVRNDHKSDKTTPNMDVEQTAHYDVQIFIPWAGSPRFEIDATENSTEEESPACYHTLAIIAKSAFSEAPGGVSISFDEGKISLVVNFPNVVGKMTITRDHTEAGGSCNSDPHNGHIETKGPWSIQLTPLTAVKATIPSSDNQSDSFTDPWGGKLTWKLKRTPMKH